MVIRVDKFLEQLATTPPEQVGDVCNCYVQSLLGAYSVAYTKKLLSATRKGVTDESILKHLRLPVKVQKSLKTGYRKSVIARNGTIKDFSVEDFVDVAEELLTSHSYINQILGIGALTGRRPYEVCVAGKLEYFDPDLHSPNYVVATNAGEVCDVNELADTTLYFTGQAKTRGQNESVQGYEIPVLASSKRIMDAFKELRRDGWDRIDMDSDTFHSRCSKQLGVSCRKFFGKIVPEVNPKALRKCYASSCEFLEFRPNNVSINLYFARILGHSHLDIATASTYQDYRGI